MKLTRETVAVGYPQRYLSDSDESQFQDVSTSVKTTRLCCRWQHERNAKSYFFSGVGELKIEYGYVVSLVGQPQSVPGR